MNHGYEEEVQGAMLIDRRHKERPEPPRIVLRIIVYN